MKSTSKLFEIRSLQTPKLPSLAGVGELAGVSAGLAGILGWAAAAGVLAPRGQIVARKAWLHLDHPRGHVRALFLGVGRIAHPPVVLGSSGPCQAIDTQPRAKSC